MQRLLIPVKGTPQVLTEMDICRIVPVRESCFLFDQIFFQGEEAVGSFVVSEKLCAGHTIAGVLTPPGHLWLDAAVQLMCVVFSHDEQVVDCLSRGRGLAVAEYGTTHFVRPIHPGHAVDVAMSLRAEFSLGNNGTPYIRSSQIFVRSASTEQEHNVRIMISFLTLALVTKEQMLA